MEGNIDTYHVRVDDLWAAGNEEDTGSAGFLGHMNLEKRRLVRFFPGQV